MLKQAQTTAKPLFGPVLHINILSILLYYYMFQFFNKNDYVQHKKWIWTKQINKKEKERKVAKYVKKVPKKL